MGEALFDHPLAQLVVAEHLDRGFGEVLRIGRPEAEAGTFDRHDLTQAAGVGGDARAFRGHRLECDQSEGFVDRRDHGQVGDPVERMENVIADPAEEGAVVHQPEFLRLLVELGFVGA